MIGPAIIHQVRATYAVLASYGVILPVLFESLCALFLIAIRPLVPGWPLPLIGIRRGGVPPFLRQTAASFRADLEFMMVFPISHVHEKYRY